MTIKRRIKWQFIAEPLKIILFNDDCLYICLFVVFILSWMKCYRNREADASANPKDHHPEEDVQQEQVEVLAPNDA